MASTAASETRRRALHTWVSFLVVFLGLLGLLSLGATVVDPALNRSTARVTAAVLRWVGAGGQADGTIVRSSLFDVNIIRDCTGIMPCLVLFSAVIAYPSRWRAKLGPLLLGIPVILVVNLIRVISLFYVGHWFPDAFDFVHLVVWQSLVLFVTLLLWLAWVVRVA